MGSAALLSNVQEMARDFGARQTAGGLIIPRNAIPLLAIGSQPSPVLGATVELVAYTVNPQWLAVITGVIFAYDGTPSLTPGSGDGIWSVDIDRPIGGPAILGYSEKDFQAIKWPLGSYASGPWPVDFLHKANETIRIKFQAVATLIPGAPNFVTGGMVGYTWPGDRA